MKSELHDTFFDLVVSFSDLMFFLIWGCDLVLSNLESQNRIWCIIDKLMDQNSVGQPKN